MRDTQVRILTVLSALLAVSVVVWLWGGPTEFEDAPWDPDAAEPVWALAEGDVQQITVRRGEADYSLVRDNESWRLIRPLELGASPQKVAVLIDDLTDLDLGIPVPDAVASDYGLSEDKRAQVEVTLKNGTKETLWVGDTAPIGWRTYVQRPGGPVIVVPGRLNETVVLNPILLRDVAFLRFDFAKLNGILIQGPEGDLDIFKDDYGWWVRGVGRADLDKLDSLAVGLANLRMEGWLDGVLAGPIKEPLFEVRLTFTDGAEDGFQVGDSLPMGRLIRLHNGMTGHVKGQVLALLQQGARQMADKRAFPFSESETQNIIVQVRDKVVTLTDSDGGWRDQAGRSAESAVNQFAVLDATYPEQLSLTSPGSDLATVELVGANGVPERFVVRTLPGDEGSVSVQQERHGSTYLMTKQQWTDWLKLVYSNDD